MIIREAAVSDVSAIANLHADSWRNTYRGAYSDAYLDGPVFDDRVKVWAERLSSPPANQYVVVAEDGGEVVGFACVYGNHSVEHGSLLDNLHVKQDLQKSGIGKQLVVEAARWCAANYPAQDMYLGVLEINANAQAFYRRLGGADVGGDTTDEPGGGTVPYRIIRWSRDQLAEMAKE